MLPLLTIPSAGTTAATVGRAAYLASKNPEKSADFMSIIGTLIIVLLIAAFVGGIAAIVAKVAFEKKGEDVTGVFCVFGGATLVLCGIAYFLG